MQLDVGAFRVSRILRVVHMLWYGYIYYLVFPWHRNHARDHNLMAIVQTRQIKDKQRPNL